MASLTSVKLNGVGITWLGHATFKVETPEGKTILIDPWVTGNPKCPEEHKQFKKVDAIFCTHGHGDHIGDAPGIAKQHDAVAVGVYEMCLWLTKKGVKQTAPMNKGGSQEVVGMTVTMVHADHSCGIEDDGQIIYGGEACGYVLTFSNGIKLYHAGDTNVFGDMAIIRELYSPEIVCLPMGDVFTMGPREAAYACGLLKPKVVIPMHFGTFSKLTGTVNDLKSRVSHLGIEVVEVEPGERIA